MTMLSVSRRYFISTSASLAGGLLVVARFEAVAEPVRRPSVGAQQLGYYVRIEADDRIVIGAPSTEMGQGINTSIPMIIAEELDADWARVEIEQLPLMIKKQGDDFVWTSFPQGAGGSDGIIDAWAILREAGARARRLLQMAAALRWNVPVEFCGTELGYVVHASTNRKASYAELAAAAGRIADPAEAPQLKTRKEYRLVGTPVRNAQAEAIVTGRAEFGIDAGLPGMLYAVVARAPQFDAQVDSIDDGAARAVVGVKQIVRLDGPAAGGAWHPIVASGVAVVATSLWSAMKGREALKVRWTPSPASGESSDTMRAQMTALLNGRGHFVNDDGDSDAGLKSAHTIVERTYDMPFVAHATMEPQNCVVHVQADRVDIIAPTQVPGSVSRLAHEITGIDRDRIAVRMTRLGGGFGRRLEADFIGEALIISKATGTPVKLVWTREDDLHHDFYRPACRHHMLAGLDAHNRLVTWKQRVASTPKNHRRAGVDENAPWEADLYLMDFPATLVSNFRREYFAVQSAAPRRSWRAPGHTANAFAIHSFIDEIAHQAGVDPLDFLLATIGNAPDVKWDEDGTIYSPQRHAGVLRLVAEKSDWKTPPANGHGRGIAAHFTFSSYCAHVVDVRANGGELVIEKVTSAIDCGFVVNPLGARAQVEGGINDALSTALGQAITIRDGAAVEGNFDTYRMMRIDKSPRRIDVHFVESPHDPTGMGEPPVPPLAPALCNAIFAAIGKRIRELPIGNQLKP